MTRGREEGEKSENRAGRRGRESIDIFTDIFRV